MNEIEERLGEFKEYMETYWDLVSRPLQGEDRHATTLLPEFLGERGIRVRVKSCGIEVLHPCWRRLLSTFFKAGY